MQRLAGRVAIVTGAGRGLGRAYALALAAEGAAVLVNDLGADTAGAGHDAGPAHAVAAEIVAGGGRAVANSGDVTDWQGARGIVQAAVDAFGGLDILVNNAGLLLHHSILTVEEADWDLAVAVNLKGHMAMTKWAMTWWAGRAAAGEAVKASVIDTTSIGAMATFGNPSYSAAKAGVANLGLVTALEGQAIGVRANVVAPGGRTRLTLAFRGEEAMTALAGGFDFNDPGNVAPLIVYLAQAGCPVTGAVFHLSGNQIGLFRQWPFVGTREAPGRWTVEALEEMMPGLLEDRFEMPSVATRLSDFMQITARAKAALD